MKTRLKNCLRTGKHRARRLAASEIALRAAHLLCMLLGLYAIAFTYISLSQLTHERRLRDVERLLVIGLLDAESGQRAYLLTDDPLFLFQYDAGVKALDRYQPVYERALRTHDGRRIFGSVRVLLQLKKAEMNLTISTHDAVGPRHAIAIVRNMRGHGYTAEIYDLLRQIQMAEAKSFVPLELWRPPSELELHDPDRTLSPSALVMKMEPR
jgi:CHASE3 domain sensor protein